MDLQQLQHDLKNQTTKIEKPINQIPATNSSKFLQSFSNIQFSPVPPPSLKIQSLKLHSLDNTMGQANTKIEPYQIELNKQTTDIQTDLKQEEQGEQKFDSQLLNPNGKLSIQIPQHDYDNENYQEKTDISILSVDEDSDKNLESKYTKSYFFNHRSMHFPKQQMLYSRRQSMLPGKALLSHQHYSHQQQTEYYSGFLDQKDIDEIVQFNFIHFEFERAKEYKIFFPKYNFSQLFPPYSQKYTQNQQQPKKSQNTQFTNQNVDPQKTRAKAIFKFQNLVKKVQRQLQEKKQYHKKSKKKRSLQTHSFKQNSQLTSKRHTKGESKTQLLLKTKSQRSQNKNNTVAYTFKKAISVGNQTKTKKRRKLRKQSFHY